MPISGTLTINLFSLNHIVRQNSYLSDSYPISLFKFKERMTHGSGTVFDFFYYSEIGGMLPFFGTNPLAIIGNQGYNRLRFFLLFVRADKEKIVLDVSFFT